MDPRNLTSNKFGQIYPKINKPIIQINETIINSYFVIHKLQKLYLSFKIISISSSMDPRNLTSNRFSQIYPEINGLIHRKNQDNFEFLFHDI